MYIHHPRMAKRWSAHTPKGRKLPKHVREDDRYSHPWQDPESILRTFGLRVEFEDLRGGRVVSVKIVRDRDDADMGGMRLVLNPELSAYQISWASTEGLPHGSGIGTSVYRAVRDYVGRKHGSTVASDFVRSPESERVWQGMSRAGLAHAGHLDKDGPLAGPGDDLTFYTMEDVDAAGISAAEEQLPSIWDFFGIEGGTQG